MREIRKWRNKLVEHLRQQWPNDAKVTPATMCDIELGLTLHLNLFPEVPAEALWIALAGYPFDVFESLAWNENQKLMLGTGRHLLPFYRSPFPWQRALWQYQMLDEYLRGYAIDAEGCAILLDVSLCSDRVEHYTQTLLQPPAYREYELQWASTGTYEYLENKRYVSVTIPEQLVFPPPKQRHAPKKRRVNPAIVIDWDELDETAQWMDGQLKDIGRDTEATWAKRFARVHLELFEETGTRLRRPKQLTIDGMLNLIGMISSGKTTFITVLAVWAARHEYHVTLVVGDVVNALDATQLFTWLGLKAAPILGASNRERHTNRLHRIVYSKHPESPLLQQHKGFDWLSTACALNGLHDQMEISDLQARPCLDLSPSSAGDVSSGKAFACPIFDRCAFHQAQRDLVNASIWVATPASLVYTSPAPQINRERLRFAELVYLHSDLVLVDEADRVQVQLDNIFSPNQTLAGRGYSAWLNQLSQQVQPRLNQEGRAQLGEENVEAWCSSHEMAQMAINRVYALLLQEDELRNEIEQDYFTAWIILERLASELSAAPTDERHEHMGYQAFMDLVEEFLNDPLGERTDTQLALMAQQSITHTDRMRTRQRIQEWIKTQPGLIINDEQYLKRAVLLLEFALVVAVLSDRLDHLLRDWKHAEVALQLDGASSIIFHRPPDDYTAVVPVSPMGNVLAFQYVRSASNEPGDLRFFRCLGVGRWMLLHLHDLFAGDGIAGPHVLLLSGTSWAGNSPGYHIQLPVVGVLRAPEAEVNAIASHSAFFFEPIFDRSGQPIFVSGRRGNARMNALFDMLHYFAERGGIKKDKPSRFERERAQLPNDRQRILLLVGSYVEARYVRESLEEIRPDWRGQVLSLVPDDDEFESNWQGQSGTLRRGLVHQLAQTDSWLLIAPLLAVERGHNILNEFNQAAIGAAFFLVRPHPRPDDIGYAIQSINKWAVDQYANPDWATLSDQTTYPVLATGENFRKAAYSQWRYLLRTPMIYSTLPSKEREAMTWSQMVTIWQVIGRLIRGGSPARVFFCDAAFATRTAYRDEISDQASSSLLVSVLQVLSPYFDDDNDLALTDKILVRTLYGPFFEALRQMKGLAHEI